MKPPTEKGRATRERIVATAATLMHEVGVEAAGIDTVVSRAGVSKSQLYHYFEGKDALIAAVVEFQSERVIRPSIERLDRIDSLTELRKYFDEVVTFHRTTGCTIGCPIGTMSAELAGRSPAAEAELARSLAFWQSAIARLLRRLSASGEIAIAKRSVHALAASTLASLQGGLLLAKISQNHAPLSASLAAAFQQIERLRP